MHNKLKDVQKQLAKLHLETNILKYEYFDASLIPNLRGTEIFDFPLMLMCPSQSTDGINPILVYDVRDEHYHLKMCVPVWKPESVDVDPNYYYDYILKEIQTVYATNMAEEIAEAFMKVLKL